MILKLKAHSSSHLTIRFKLSIPHIPLNTFLMHLSDMKYHLPSKHDVIDAGPILVKEFHEISRVTKNFTNFATNFIKKMNEIREIK